MKKILNNKEEVGKLLARWGVSYKVVNDGSRYGSINPNDWVNNELLGICKVREIMDLEKRGAIVHKDIWRIKTEPKVYNDKNGVSRLTYVPTEAWYDYQSRDALGLKKSIYKYNYDDGQFTL